MSTGDLYNIRMRASDGKRHVSGAERIVPAGEIDTTVRELVARAMSKGCLPDQIVITAESLNGVSLRQLAALDLVTLRVFDEHEGRTAASHILQKVGVSAAAAEIAIRHIGNGASPSGGNMRGAMIVDALTGERLEPDHERGVRVSRFDWSDEAALKIARLLLEIGLTHVRTREALALATKVAHAPGTVAELCWSDDPDYTAGYVASLSTGYVRFPFLKSTGDERGGRAFFIRRGNFDMNAFLVYLQTEPVLITGVGACRPAINLDEFVRNSKLQMTNPK